MTVYKLVNANAVPYLGVWESAKTSEKIESAFGPMQSCNGRCVAGLACWGGLDVLGEGARHGRVSARGEEVPAPSVDQ